MSDIALLWSANLQAADFAIEANDLEEDGGLESAIMLSLFTDRRAGDGDVLPDGETDRRGWWADAYPVVSGDAFGSRLWLLARSKQTPDFLVREDEYVREALQWLLDDKVADRFGVAVEFPRRGMSGLVVTVYRPAVDPVEFRFNRTWAAQEAQRA